MGKVITDPASANINEAINFLDKYAPAIIASLKLEYPEHSDLLKGGILQGEEEEYSFEELLVKAGICQIALKAVIHQCIEEKPKIRQRLKNLANVQLITQILIATSSAALITTLSKKEGSNIAVYASICALVGSLLTIYVQFKSGVLGQSTKNAFLLYDNLVTNSFQAEAYEKEFLFFLQIKNANSFDKLNSLTDAANKLCFETRRLLEDLK